MKEHKMLGQKQVSKVTLHFVWGYISRKTNSDMQTVQALDLAVANLSKNVTEKLLSQTARLKLDWMLIDFVKISWLLADKGPHENGVSRVFLVLKNDHYIFRNIINNCCKNDKIGVHTFTCTM